MKKMISLMIAMLCLATMLAGTASADGGSWYCGNCGMSRDSEFCPDCGARRPAGGSETISDEGWPVMQLAGAQTALQNLGDESKRHQSFFGPNRKNYGGAGAYKPYKVTRATALFREGDYVLVDMSYRTVGRRCVYFRAGSLTNSQVDSVTLTPHPALVNSTVQPLYGPGTEYDPVVNNVSNPQTGKVNTQQVYVEAGSRVNVLLEARGWVFAEFSCALGTIRAWLPADTVRSDDVQG